MVFITDKTQEQVIFFPKTKEGNPAYLKLFSQLRHDTYRFNVTDVQPNKLYYGFLVDFSDVVDGEYDYSLENLNDEVLEEGLIRVGDLDAGNVVYDLTETYFIYNPETGDSEIINEDSSCQEAADRAYHQGYEKGIQDAECGSAWENGFDSGYTSGNTDGFNSGYTSGHTDGYSEGYEDGQAGCESCGWVSIRTPFNLPSSATEINYTITSNMPFDFTVYVMNDEMRDWDTYASTIHSETSPYNGTIQIPVNSGTTVKEYQIAAGLDDDCATHFEAYVIQAPGSADCSEVYEEGYQAGLQAGINSGYTEGYASGWTDGYSSGWTDGYNSGHTPTPPTPPTPSGYTDVRFSVEMLEDGDIEWDGVILYYDIIRDGQRDEGYQLDHGILGLLEGDVVEFYTKFDNPVSFSNKILTATGRHNVYGNIMSLLYVDFEDIVAIPNNYEFEHLFNGNTKLINAENLVLPATTLKQSCYRNMFYNCANLISAPALPATTLVATCYENMFAYCTSLTQAPELPATDITASSCYKYLFDNCSSLNYVKCLAVNRYQSSTEKWLRNVSATGTFVKSTDATWSSGNDGVPSGWTVISE